ncbi:Putative cytochrome c family protein (modular protein) [Candidatus Sulfotelmatomonas gaucii]|uniref:Cytochrome c family protein (Modular protein) n=1 Tax=Candidatus Sulfuritelmatomonas gaucii TaxID=2043161 RepID=A0A2N9L7J3_9BACT|nr:Putative cytochrome c family protein (modular protein) [Candidatus Sulfotelmatomonas gaucii]
MPQVKPPFCDTVPGDLTSRTAPPQTEEAGCGKASADFGLLLRGLPEDFPISIQECRECLARRGRESRDTNRCVAIWAGIIGCLAIGFTGCRKAPNLTPEQAEGKHVYDAGCAHCHEENDLHLKKVPPNLHGLFNHKVLPDGEPATDGEVGHLLMTGKGMMPSFAYQLTKEQMDALLAYLHTGMRDEQSP